MDERKVRGENLEATSWSKQGKKEWKEKERQWECSEKNKRGGKRGREPVKEVEEGWGGQSKREKGKQER